MSESINLTANVSLYDSFMHKLSKPIGLITRVITSFLCIYVSICNMLLKRISFEILIIGRVGIGVTSPVKLGGKLEFLPYRIL